MKMECNNLIAVKNASDLEYARLHYFIKHTKILTHCQNCGKPIM